MPSASSGVMPVPSKPEMVAFTSPAWIVTLLPARLICVATDFSPTVAAASPGSTDGTSGAGSVVVVVAGRVVTGAADVVVESVPPVDLTGAVAAVELVVAFVA